MLAFLARLVLQALQVLVDYLVPLVLMDSRVLQVQEVALDQQVMQASKVHWVKRDLLETLDRKEMQDQLDFLAPLGRRVHLDN